MKTQVYLYSKAFAAIFAILLSVSLFIGWLPIMCYAENAPEPDVPLITYGEFPFTVVFEVNGREYTIEDAIVCEYLGSNWNEGDGKKHRKWNFTFKSGEFCILHTVNEEVYVLLGTGLDPAYLMGDKENASPIGKVHTQLLTYHDSYTSVRILDDKEAFDKYGVRIQSFEVHALPIENTFVSAE